MRRLTFAEAERLRGTYGKTVLLFITDRCPVGCAHCSVDSRPDSPTVADFPLFAEIVAGICSVAEIEAVAISGGEPFVERRALPLAVRQVRDAGKATVVFTSGFWATGARCQPWIAEVLRMTGTVFLSTDSFHQGTVSMERFRRAAGFIAAAGCRLVVQILDQPDVAGYAGEVLTDLFGPDWTRHADLNRVPNLALGRGRSVFQITTRHRLDHFTPCRMTKAPTIRYDGTVIGCCNEALVLGAGPAALRRQVRDRHELVAALRSLRAAPLLRAVATVP
ncbi:hypothetical protein [Phytohabitans rumicis]|uniref:Radical SAM core domain-containing protein n=2 Tax=Phytohabitans rumicis TaxID=1076125 RepID=A0A6V8KTM1_9ACTN|nr:hypothetical protein [Phytohabitans rumicis]GFJ87164.1 hypothetical protein Prum_008060 [Phytohabitans rumicis]